MSRYSDLILSDGPELYWRLNEDGSSVGGSAYGDGTYGGGSYGGGGSSSTAILDFSGNGNDGQFVYNDAPGLGGVSLSQPGAISDGDDGVAINGTWSPPEGPYDSGHQLNPGSGFRADAYAPYAVGSKRTYEAWVYKRDASQGMETLFSAMGTTHHPTWEFNTNDDGTPTFRYYADVSTFPVGWRDWGTRSAFAGRPSDFTDWFGLTGLEFEVLRWKHVVCTYDDATKVAEVFVNGRSQGQLGAAYFVTPNHGSGNGRFQVGIRSTGGSGNFEVMNGVIDEVAIYERILTPTQILQHYLIGAQAHKPPFPSLPPIRVTTETPSGRGYDLTEKVEALQWSNVNPGGDEAASFTYRRPWSADLPEIAQGSVLRVSHGLDVLFSGRIEEPDRGGDSSELVAVTAYGLGVRLKDNEMQECYVDRAAERWQAPTLNFRLTLAAFGFVLDQDFSASAEQQSLAFDGTNNKTVPQFSQAVLEYLLPDGLAASEFQYRAVESGVGNIAAPSLSASDSDYFSPFIAPIDSYALTADDTLRSRAIDTPRQFLMLQISRSAATGTESNIPKRHYSLFAVYGDHGLTHQDNGTEPAGFNPHQVVADAAGRVAGIAVRRLDQTSFVIDHLVFLEPTPHEDVISAANAYEGADWGTWGPDSVLDRSTDGHFDYTARDPATQHWLCSRADLDAEPQLQSELSNLFNVVKVAFTDQSGTERVVTRTATVAALEEAGITRTASIDGGTLTAALAGKLADTFLAIQGDHAPARGSVTIAKPIRHHRRGLLPPTYMRADGSNLRIADVLPTSALFALDDSPDRRATFPIKRVSVDASGPAVKVSAELDQSFDAMSILQARLALGADFLPAAASRNRFDSASRRR